MNSGVTKSVSTMSENSPSNSPASGPATNSGPSVGKSIVFGSFIIACGLFAAALVLPERAAPVVAAAAPAVQQAPATAGAGAGATAGANASPAAPGRYQIVKTENGASWRLDTVTGEITVCRLEADRMICAKSTEATELPQVSAAELEKQRAEQRAERRAEKTEMFDKFFGFFERMLNFAEKHADKVEPPDSEQYARPL